MSLIALEQTQAIALSFASGIILGIAFGWLLSNILKNGGPRGA